MNFRHRFGIDRLSRTFNPVGLIRWLKKLNKSLGLDSVSHCETLRLFAILKVLGATSGAGA